ncbi:unnamed protein product [Schistocephalus solidus]|uniref:Matrix Gla protein n=1 Tax=Schistocephalus solidus TaxID=70667 RepID=A0A183TUJ8_SCHSO|nr:unnamed protein product [Schistocephalus solidus]
MCTALILLVGVLVLSGRLECAKPSALEDAFSPTEEELVEEELEEALSSVDPLPGYSADLAPAGFSLRRFIRRVGERTRRIFRIRRCWGEECQRYRSRWPQYNPYIFEKRLKD